MKWREFQSAMCVEKINWFVVNNDHHYHNEEYECINDRPYFSEQFDNF